MKTPMAKMADYMADIKRSTGYESLKSQYLQQFPSLQKENTSNIDDRIPGEGDEENDLLPTNPIERRDAKIAELENTVADMAHLQETVVKTKARLNIAIKTAIIAKSKVKFARKVTEERLKECLPEPFFVIL